MKRYDIGIVAAVVLILIVALSASGNGIIRQVGNQTITADDVDAVQTTQEFMQDRGASIESISDSQTLQMLTERVLIEQQFDQYGITLTDQEQESVNQYLVTQEAFLQEMLQSEKESERENAQEVLRILSDYMQEMNLTPKTYNEKVIADLSYTIQYEKLLELVYHGDESALKASLPPAENYLDSGKS